MPIPIIHITHQPISASRIPQNTHPSDILTVQEDKTIGVPIIRAIQSFLKSGPIASKSKVVVINNAQFLTPIAQNAFLKTLEEPPVYAQIFLQAPLTDAFLPTLLSRCRLIYDQPSPPPLTPDLKVLDTLNHQSLIKRLEAIGQCTGNREQALNFVNSCINTLHHNVNQNPTPTSATRLKSLIRAAQRLNANAHVALTLENLALHW